ncbi:enoyl-CoA hydratase/isomerase family protein [Streptomyces dysideae]|uniref:enoyl-CoA hydratase n=1 Tax=Streptomyces dysideae TaxID=909626 RepID=A0A101UTC7_9ACTN|nr:enoyl-CoA hydratase/isomerase family protein [Streptomyces dysideae]KUO16410.1 3-hydroxypropionyl-CoA dehydratase [Streptomyces dysideae]
MTTSTVHYEVVGAAAVLTLDHPPVNAMNRPLTMALAEALERAHDDTHVRAVVVTAAGQQAFCAGSDIKEIVGLREPGAAVELKLRPQKEVFDHLAHFPKPTIAALNGLCYGGGLEIAVCCDLIVAEEHVKIASPEITLGLFPSSGGTLRTTRRIGVGRAKEIMLLAEPIDALTALSWGLINRVTPTGDSLKVALGLAEQLADRPATGTAMCKAAIDLAFDTDENQALEHTLAFSERAFTSAEAGDGVDAFVAKTKPDYRLHPYPPRDAAAVTMRGADA